MNDSSNVEGISALKGAFSVVGVAALSLFAFLLLMGGAIGVVEMPIHLAFGWIFFVARTIPKITINPNTVAFSLLCLAATLIIAHRFITWIVNSNATPRSSTFHWRWKWTCAGFSGISLLFLVGMAVVGLAHQIGWLLTTSEPMYTRGGFIVLENHVPMRDVTTLFRSGGYRTIDQFKADINMRPIPFDRSHTETIPDRFHILVITSATNQVAGVLVFPRDTKSRERFGGLMVAENEEYPVLASHLSQAIKTNQHRLISLY